MATASSQITDIDQGKALRLRVEVGAATWHVVLAPDAVAALAHHDDVVSMPPLSERATDRLMKAVRAKAIRLHWYGGGTMTIDAPDLAPALPDEDATPARWYRVTDSHTLSERQGHLRSVT